MAELLGEFGSQGEDGVGHSLVILLGVGEAPAFQKCAVNLFPDTVGVDEGSIQIEKQQGLPLLFQPEAPGKLPGLF